MEKKLNVPNTITFSRLIFGFLYIYYLLQNSVSIALPFLLFFIILDGVDGYIARKFNQVTVFGTHLDPIIDAIVVVSIFFTYFYLGFLSQFHIILFLTSLVLIGSVDFFIIIKKKSFQRDKIAQVTGFFVYSNLISFYISPLFIPLFFVMVVWIFIASVLKAKKYLMGK